MTIEQTLQTEIEESKKWLGRETEETTYKRDLQKRIELLNWVLENMKNPNIYMCALIESKMNEIIETINKTYSIIEADKLHSELRILVVVFLLVCEMVLTALLICLVLRYYFYSVTVRLRLALTSQLGHRTISPQ
jgi:hypothetical protein